MPTFVHFPAFIQAENNKPQIIEEHIGRANMDTAAVSVARMRSPGGWEEPGQTPELDEYTVVLRGTLRVRSRTETIDVGAGQAVISHRGEWVQRSLSCPFRFNRSLSDR